jgi:hypothetical protein
MTNNKFLSFAIFRDFHSPLLSWNMDKKLFNQNENFLEFSSSMYFVNVLHFNPLSFNLIFLPQFQI